MSIKEYDKKDDIMCPKPAWYSALNGIKFAKDEMGIFDLDYGMMFSTEKNINTSIILPILFMEKN